MADREHMMRGKGGFLMRTCLELTPCGFWDMTMKDDEEERIFQKRRADLPHRRSEQVFECVGVAPQAS